MIEMSKFIVNKHEETVNKKKRALFVIAVILLLTPCAADAQQLWERVKTGEDIISGNVYIITDKDNEYVMGEIGGNGARKHAQPIDFNCDSDGEIGKVEIENTEDDPYEITITKEDNGYYSLKTAEGYVYHHDETYFGVNDELLKGDKYYWDFSFEGTRPKFIPKDETERLIYYYYDGGYFCVYKRTSSNINLFRKLDGIDVTISEVGYATLYYSDKNLYVPEDVTAFTVEHVDDTLKISRVYKSLSIIPENTAVILSGEEGTYTFFETESTGEASNDNALLGTDEETALEADDSCYFYILSLNKDNDISSVGFYWANSDGSAFTNAAHKAYLKLPKSSSETSGSPKSSFLFSELVDSDEAYEEEDYDAEGDISADSETSFGGGVTGIAAVEGGASGELGEVCYTIQGVKIDKPTAKGLYIINGKKYVIK